MGNSSSKHKSSKRSIQSRKIQQPIQNIPTYEPDYRAPQQAYDYSTPQYPQQQQQQQQHYEEEAELVEDFAVPGNVYADIDSCISRLIAVGQQRHIGKNVCITNDEIIAICRYAYDLFLSQPVSSCLVSVYIRGIHVNVCIAAVGVKCWSQDCRRCK